MHGNLWLQLFQQVPRNSFAFAVFVRCQIQRSGIFQCGFQFLHYCASTLGELVGRLETVLHIHRETLARKVCNVAHRGANIKVRTEVLGDGFGLGGGLNDD